MFTIFNFGHSLFLCTAGDFPLFKIHALIQQSRSQQRHVEAITRKYTRNSTRPEKLWWSETRQWVFFPFKRNRQKMNIFILATALFYSSEWFEWFYKHNVLKNSKTYKDLSIKDSSRRGCALSTSLLAFFPEPHAAEILQNNDIQGTKTAKENCLHAVQSANGHLYQTDLLISPNLPFCL